MKRPASKGADTRLINIRKTIASPKGMAATFCMANSISLIGISMKGSKLEGSISCARRIDSRQKSKTKVIKTI